MQDAPPAGSKQEGRQNEERRISRLLLWMPCFDDNADHGDDRDGVPDAPADRHEASEVLAKHEFHDAPEVKTT